MSEKIYNPNKRAFKDVSNFQAFEKQMEREAEKLFTEYSLCIEKQMQAKIITDADSEAGNLDAVLSKNYSNLYRFYVLLQCIFEKEVSERRNTEDDLLQGSLFNIFSLFLERANNLLQELFTCIFDTLRKAECSLSTEKYNYIQEIYALSYLSAFIYHSQIREELARECLHSSNSLFEYEWVVKDPKIWNNENKICLEQLAKYSDIENLGFNECGLSKRFEYPSYLQIFSKKNSDDFYQEDSKENQMMITPCCAQKALLAYFKIFTVCMLFLGKNNKKLIILEIYLRNIIKIQ